ncbi:phage integrase SAM-like domain-containing protein [Mucilaginibacter litoreus]|uniref:Phage integrase SAM-like domain-containing protein n=1 Tax=Mucilaginibacter litoreus TaxID=1048221 RepID=A0ABW3AUJ3_9SPHI
MANIYLSELWENGKLDVHCTDTSSISRFHEFTGVCDIPFTEINSELLRRYTLFSDAKKKRNGNENI